MLKQRIVTAILMLAVLLPALFYVTPTPFCVVALLLIGAGAWEWSRLNTLGQGTSVGLALACMAACSLAWYAGLLGKSLLWLWAAGGGFWILTGAWLLRNGVSSWPRIPRILRVCGGLLALWLAWLAVAQARVIGTNFLMSVLLLVWVADIFAYFAGRAFGGRFCKSRLAPSISPNKSWEGVWGGMAGVLAVSLVWVWLARAGHTPEIGLLTGPTFYFVIFERLGFFLLLLALVFLTAMSIVGDLVESLVKRSAGVKDSSGLLPGHGGVLDRLDALLPTLPLAMMLVSL